MNKSVIFQSIIYVLGDFFVRPTSADSSLQHPWLAAKAEAGKQELIELITKIKKTEEEYRNAAEDPPNADTPAETEDNDDSSSTSHPSMRGVPEPPPREPSPGKAYGCVSFPPPPSPPPDA